MNLPNFFGNNSLFFNKYNAITISTKVLFFEKETFSKEKLNPERKPNSRKEKVYNWEKTIISIVLDLMIFFTDTEKEVKIWVQ